LWTYPLALHVALPICRQRRPALRAVRVDPDLHPPILTRRRRVGPDPAQIAVNDRRQDFARRLRVCAAFRAEACRSALGRAALFFPPMRPPFFAGEVSTFFPRPEPDFLPPPVILLTVAQARRAASLGFTPRSS